jgi:hypothetical protein
MLGLQQGAARGGRRECDAIDEFDAVALGTHRSTEDWLAAAPEGDRNRDHLPGNDSLPPMTGSCEITAPSTGHHRICCLRL